jgi:hypothetical protein
VALSLIAPRVVAADVTLEQVGRWARSNNDFIHVQLYGSYLYAGTFSSGWYVIDVSDPSTPAPIATNSGFAEREVWGLKVIEGTLVTSHGNRAGVYDLSDPASPSMVDSSMGMFGTYGADAELFESLLVPGSRGLTWYKSGTAFPSPAFNAQIFDMQAAGGYLYAIGGSLYVLEKSDLRLTAPSVIATSGTGIRVSGDTVLVAGGGLRLYDLANPAKPSFLSSGFAGSGMNKLEVDGQYAYVASGSVNGVQVVDWSDRRNLKMAGRFNTAGGCVELCVSGEYIYVADGLNGIVILKQTITTPPAGLTIVSSPPPTLVLGTGETLNLAVEATSAAPISYQWSASEVLAENGPSLTIANVNRSHSGLYTVQVSDGTSTETFQTTVRVQGNLHSTLIDASIPPMIYVSDPFGTLEPAYLILETSTNLTDWEQLLDYRFTSDPPGAFVGIGNNPAEPARFYRVTEGPEPF